MLEDMLEDIFQHLVVEKERWRKVNSMMARDEQAALAGLIDILAEAKGFLPIAT